MLVATCPCALSLATPTAITVAITALLKKGIAITHVRAVENLNRISHVIFDKTGTLTLDKLKLDSTQPLSEIDLHACLAIAAALEKHSEHPVGRAILDAVCGSTILPARNIKNFPGQGVTGRIGDTQYSIGTLNFVSNHTGLAPASGLEGTLTNGDNTTIFLADSSRVLCAFTFRDEIRPHAGALIKFIKHSGRKVILLSGDREANVRKIGETLDIDIIVPEMKPEDKLIFVRNLQEQNAIVAMVGDGINDAPVLACADVSIAMGGGTDIAKINADIILLNDQLDKLQIAMNIAHKTFVIIRQNIIWAIVYNLLILPSAAMGFVAPWMAALGMSLSSLVVVANASRIK
jgi:Cu2+-exporting ATPase